MPLDRGTQGRVLGYALGFVAVVLLQVYAFGERWWRALLYGAILTAGAVAYFIVRRRREP